MPIKASPYFRRPTYRPEYDYRPRRIYSYEDFEKEKSSVEETIKHGKNQPTQNRLNHLTNNLKEKP